jgi:protein required for attachment to host cells
MDTTWIVVADSSRARIFELQEGEQHLREIEDFLNISGRADADDLRTDERGRFYGKGERNQAHTADPAVFPVEHENELFSRTITQYLDNARNQQRYTRLCLIAAPKFLGLLRNNLHKEVHKLIEEDLPKNISTFTRRQIEEYVKEKTNI